MAAKSLKTPQKVDKEIAAVSGAGTTRAKDKGGKRSSSNSHV
jgi:hypothetical protein